MIKLSNVQFVNFTSAVAMIIIGADIFAHYKANRVQDMVFCIFGFVCMTMIHLILSVRKKAELAVPIVFIFLVIIGWYWIYYGERDGFGAFWVLTVPLCSFYVFEVYIAATISACLLAEMIIFMWSPYRIYAYPYPDTVRLWAPVLFTIMALCSGVMKAQNTKLIKEQKKLTEQAEAANKAKNDFLSSTSHEIRTPINTILGMTELILKESEDKNVLEYASCIDTAGKTLLSVVNDVLDVTKIESGYMDIKNREYRLAELLKDCYSLVLQRCEKNNNTLVFKCDTSIPSKLSGDAEHIRLMLINLLTNAAKYTNDGLINLIVSGRINGETIDLEFRVEDNGVGIKEEELELVFHNYTRSESARISGIEGTGLGLAITRKLARLMGGDIIAESVYGQGSTFTLQLTQTVVDFAPVGVIDWLDRSEHISKAKSGEVFKAIGKRILVVDDVESNLKLIKYQLKNCEAVVDTAVSGKEAIDMVSANSYDIIFLDKMMPEMDGIQTLAEIKAMPEFIDKNIPVIMLTADATAGNKDDALDSGFSDFITKPVSIAQLDNTLRRFLCE
ncbi:MAG: response regulator [Pseudobutyrivibrio sp.]|nr:response regulator [Pseudobutyrivibrio sp.]